MRLWKVELQKLADETGLTLQVCHYPPGTSKWNKIEHRMFCHITQNWRGKPLISRLAVVELIAATTTKTGLTVRCELDTNTYPKGIKVTDAEMATLNIKGDAFHPEWNYPCLVMNGGGVVGRIHEIVEIGDAGAGHGHQGDGDLAVVDRRRRQQAGDRDLRRRRRYAVCSRSRFP